MSKPYVAVLSALVCAMGASAPASAGDGEPGRATAKDIGQLETAYSQSFVTGDTHVAERLLSADFVGFGSSGKLWDKAAVLAEVRALPHQASAKITSIVVRTHGDTAVALGTEEDSESGSAAVSRREWLDTWRRTARGWRMVASAEIEPRP